MFLIVFKALFTEFCKILRKKDSYAYQNSSLLHKKTVLILETSSEINFEFIKL